MPRTKKVSEPKKTQQYEAIILVENRKYTGKGDSILEALSSVRPSDRVRGRGILIVSHGTKTVEKIISPFVVTRLFSASRLARELTLKNLSTLFEI